LCYTGWVKRAVLCFLVALFIASGSLAAVDAGAELNAAVTLAERGEVQGAWERLRMAGALSEEQVPTLMRLARAFEEDGCAAEAADVYVQCARLQPASIGTKALLAALIGRLGPPLWIRPEYLADMPLDARRVAPGGGLADVVLARNLRSSGMAATDPRFRKRFPKGLWVYLESPKRDQLRLAFVVHFQREGDAALASRSAVVLGALADLARERLGLWGRFAPDGVVHLWLCPFGQPGGEQWQEHLYLYSIDTERQPAEWIRELAHEYGHEVIPGIGGFAKPEEWANGLLGERLFVEWLAALHLRSLWGEDVDLGSVSRSGRKAALGAFRAAVEGRGSWSADAYTGLVLYIDGANGTGVLRDAIAATRGDSPAAFLAGYASALRQRRTYPVASLGDIGLLFYAPDPGEYRLQLRGGSGLAVDGRPATAPVRLTAGWHRASWAAGSGSAQSVTVSRVVPGAGARSLRSNAPPGRNVRG